jgi:hypothetical protein
MSDTPEWRKSREAERLDAIGRLLRARFNQIASAPTPPRLIELVDQLEAKASQSVAGDDDDDDDETNGHSPPKASDA